MKEWAFPIQHCKTKLRYSKLVSPENTWIPEVSTRSVHKVCTLITIRDTASNRDAEITNGFAFPGIFGDRIELYECVARLVYKCKARLDHLAILTVNWLTTYWPLCPGSKQIKMGHVCVLCRPGTFHSKRPAAYRLIAKRLILVADCSLFSVSYHPLSMVVLYY